MLIYIPPHAGHILVSGAADHTLRGWDLLSCKCLYKIEAHSDTVTAVKIKVSGTTQWSL